MTSLYVSAEEQNVRGNDGDDGISDGLKNDFVVRFNEGFDDVFDHRKRSDKVILV